MPARLLTWYWQRNFPREFTENYFAVFDQSSHVILLRWYCRLYFFPWIPRGDPLNGSVKDFLSYHRGVTIIQFCSISVSFGSMYFFCLFCFFCFLFITSLRLECSRSRKTTSFLMSHRLKKYKNLHPPSFANWGKTR